MTEQNPGTSFQLTPIGYVKSGNLQAQGTPIQSRHAQGHQGELVLLPEYAEGLTDIEGFSRLWLIFGLHLSTKISLTVVPYRDTVERGLYSTRAPARPNRLGLSAVKLLGREGHRLLLDELDLLNGTPVFDIKPYIPEYDSFPDERIGWIAESAIAPQTITADSRFHDGKS